MFTSLKRIFYSGWSNFSRDGGLIAANIFIMVVTISAITSLFLFQDVSHFLINSLKEKVDVSVYFKEDVSQDEIFQAKKEISQLIEVKKVEYLSREQALEKFLSKYEKNPTIMESIGVIEEWKPLASLNIKAQSISDYEKIAKFLETASFQDLIDHIDYYQRKPVIEKIFSLTSILKKGGISLSFILALIAILVAFNTIRLSIYNRQEEIKIQRLVGASNWFIKGPFLVQGVIIGFFSTLICLLIFSLFCYLLGPKLEILFSGLNLFTLFSENFWTIFLIQLLTGIGLGIISSLIAIRKYLKV